MCGGAPNGASPFFFSKSKNNVDILYHLFKTLKKNKPMAVALKADISQYRNDTPTSSNPPSVTEASKPQLCKDFRIALPDLESKSETIGLIIDDSLNWINSFLSSKKSYRKSETSLREYALQLDSYSRRFAFLVDLLNAQKFWIETDLEGISIAPKQNIIFFCPKDADDTEYKTKMENLLSRCQESLDNLFVHQSKVYREFLKLNLQP